MAKHEPFDYEKYRPVLLDSTGRKLTSGLFEELADPASSVKPVFKLADWRRIYVEIADPTDYQAARVLIGNWDHWEALAANPRFKEHLELWRKEVEVKLRSEAIEHLRKQARTDKGTAAAKWLAERGEAPAKRGRPVKGAPEEPDHRSAIRDDAKRLGLALVGGTK